MSSSRPSVSEQEDFLDKTLEQGGIGIKLLGGHFPMDLDISESFIDIANQKKAWVAWHVGSTKHGSKHRRSKRGCGCSRYGSFSSCVAHVNSYCRGQVLNERDEAFEAIELPRRTLIFF